MIPLFLSLLINLSPTETSPFYHAEVIRVVDGDTFEARVDCGWDIYTIQMIRVINYDAPERRDELGPAATEYAKEILESVQLRPHKEDSFGRWLCDVNTEMGDFVVLMREKGYDSHSAWSKTSGPTKEKSPPPSAESTE